MKTNLQIAFTISVYHSYFKDNICSCISLIPGAVTKSLLKRFDCKYNNPLNKFGFYCNCNSPISAFLNYIRKTTGTDYFDFEINTDDQNFNYFTDLPVNWVGQLIFDTRSADNRFEKNILSLREKLSTGNNTNSLGILKIRFDDIIRYSSERTAAQFEIRFSSRSTQWQYFIINKSDAQVQNPVIGKADTRFTGPESVTIKTGEQALLFTSGKKLFPLMQYPGQTFSLVGNKTIIKTLPCPDPAMFDFVDVGGVRQVSSPMYVFI